MSAVPIETGPGGNAGSVAGLVHRYADAVVHRNEEQWLATWAPDAEWELGPGRSLSGSDEIIEFWRGAMDRFASVVQTVLNGDADLDSAAGTGTGRWYIQEQFCRIDGTVGSMVAHYDDRYTLTDDGWRFGSRGLVIHYSGGPDLSGQFHNAWAEVSPS